MRMICICLLAAFAGCESVIFKVNVRHENVEFAAEVLTTEPNMVEYVR